MSVEGKSKQAAGFIEEEIGEAIGSDKMAAKGRKLRNEGNVLEGEPRKTTKPGTGN